MIYNYRSPRKFSKRLEKLTVYSDTSDQYSSAESTRSSVSSSSGSVDSETISRMRKQFKRGKGYSKPLKRIPVSEWRIKYDGKDSGRKLAEFLKEVKMRRRAETISERELFRSAIHLFTGRAKDWFMEGMENRDFRNWTQLKSELKREFLPPDLDFQLEIQATNRRQARGEKFVDYLHDMQKIFQSMTRSISEKRKFEIIWRNMRFDYKNAMTGACIKSLPKLKRYGRIVDENNWSIFQKPFENSSKPRSNQLNEISTPSKTNNTQQKTKNNKQIEASKQQKQKVEEEQQKTHEGQVEPMEGSTKGTLKMLVEQYKRPPIGTCYNCRKQGHYYFECEEPRHTFCRICGFPDVLTKTCPRCPKNLESSA